MTGLGQDYLEQGFYVLLRVGPIVGFMPGFGERVVPLQVKLVLALCFSIAVLPVLDTASLTAAHEAGFVATLAIETSKGLFLGLSLRFFVILLQTAGSMAAQATSLAQLFAGSSAEPMPAIGHLLVVGALALAMVMDLPLRVLEFIVVSYETFPLSSGIDLGLFAEWAGKLVSKCFALSFSLAAPFLIMSLLYNMTLGVINRAMPQLMVAFVGAPVITAGGLLFLFLFSGIILSAWWQAFEQFLFRPEIFVR
nr:flagellar biosynthetic protein FliR [Lentibacter algarum]